MQSVKLLQNMVSNALHTLHPLPTTTVCINCTLTQGREKRGRVESCREKDGGATVHKAVSKIPT
jgi:hypothetical protein